MASDETNWQRIRPDTPLSELTAGDLMEAIGWAISSGQTAGGKPAIHGDEEVSAMGWKEVGVWGNWRSNWWGLPSE